MPDFKEPIYFCRDLVQESLAFHGADSKSSFHITTSESDYFSFFAPRQDENAVGEASSWYLCSKVAAAEIKQFNPDARIIVMLRNPVEILYSLHSQLLYAGHETINDFSEALSAEPERRAGKRVNPHIPWPSLVYYSEVTKMVEQIDRYRKHFDSSKVKFVLYEDLRDSTAKTYKEVLRFLQVDTQFLPSFAVEHASKVPRFRIPFKPFLKKAATRMLPRSHLHRIAMFLKKYNTVYADRKEMSVDLRDRLTEQHRNEVIGVSEIIGRDLTSIWMC